MNCLKCRFCLEPHHPEAGSFSLQNVPFNTAIKRVFSFEIKSEQRLPDYACKVCSAMVWKFYTFSVLVEDNQLKLRQECTMPSTEPPESSPTDGNKNVMVKSEPKDTTSTIVGEVPSNTVDKESANEIPNPLPQIKLEPQDVESTTANCEDDSVGKTQPGLENDLTDNITIEEYTITPSYSYDTEKASPDVHLPLDDGNTNNVLEHNETETDDPCEAEGTAANNSQHNPQDLPTTVATSFKCDECERTFNSRVQLKNHQRMHKTGECPICKKSIKRELVKEHLAAHEGNFRCDICDASLGSSRSLRMHKELRHAPQAQPGDKTFPCSMCERTFCNKSQLSLHRNIHNTKQCPICLKQIQSMNFQTHINIHQGAHYCELCQRAFSSRRNLTIHKRAKHSTVVDKVPDKVCDQCGLTFPNMERLAVHRKAHQRKECPVCGKTFRPNKMKEHLASHDGAFRCASCGKTFSTKYSLKKHRRRSAQCESENSDEASEPELPVSAS